MEKMMEQLKEKYNVVHSEDNLPRELYRITSPDKLIKVMVHEYDSFIDISMNTNDSAYNIFDSRAVKALISSKKCMMIPAVSSKRYKWRYNFHKLEKHEALMVLEEMMRIKV